MKKDKTTIDKYTAINEGNGSFSFGAEFSDKYNSTVKNVIATYEGSSYLKRLYKSQRSRKKEATGDYEDIVAVFETSEKRKEPMPLFLQRLLDEPEECLAADEGKAAAFEMTAPKNSRDIDRKPRPAAPKSTNKRRT